LVFFFFFFDAPWKALLCLCCVVLLVGYVVFVGDFWAVVWRVAGVGGVYVPVCGRVFAAPPCSLALWFFPFFGLFTSSSRQRRSLEKEKGVNGGKKR
jgi:hypothetical protein